MAAALKTIIVALCIAMTACSPSLVNYETRVHVVRPGDTLYTIAWRYGLDYRSLARWNRLDNPDLIFVGQRLSLLEANTPRQANSSTRSAPPPLPQPSNLPAPDWDWPTMGTVAARFGSRSGIGSGISVTGQNGQSISAAAAGRVVYVGTGLAGYGQLVIIKHNDTFLSAYGHTDNVVVDQGDEVASGQRIAAMGLGPGRQAQLHFEIRRNGVPIDPLSYLPAR